MSEKYKMAAELAKMARLATAGVHEADRSVIVGLTLGAAEMQKVEMENQDLLAALKECVTAVNDLIAESEGVYGLHLNGDYSPWSEIEEGGRFETWLLPIADATRLIAKLKEN